MTPGDEWPAYLVGHPARRGAAKREAGHEGREDGAGGMDGDAEHERQQSHPEHLIDEGAEAGQEEEEEEHFGES